MPSMQNLNARFDCAKNDDIEILILGSSSKSCDLNFISKSVLKIAESS